MSLITIIVGSDDKKAKINKFYPKKITIDTIQGNVFLYIYLKFDYKFNFLLLQCFSLNFSIPFP